MTLFHSWGMLLPALIALVIPAIAAWRLERNDTARAVRDSAIAMAVLVGVLVVSWIFSGVRFAAMAKAAGFALGFAGFVAGAFGALVCCRVRPAAAQAAVGVVVALLVASVFVAGPAIESAPLPEKSSRAELLVQVNPYAVMAGDALEVDVLREPVLYSTHIVDYLRGYPSWWRVAGAYLLAGLLLAGAGFGARRALGAR